MPPTDRLEKGDILRYTYKGEWEYSQWLGDGHLLLDPVKIPIGTVIKAIVWKKDRPEVRGTFTLKRVLPCRHGYEGGIGCQNCAYLETLD